jgi:amidohydrolase
VLSIGTFHAGQRQNIISGRAEMTGTLRTYSEERQACIQRRVAEIVENVARGMDGKATVKWEPNSYPVTMSDPALTAWMLPSPARATGSERLLEGPGSTAGEDFSCFAQQAPRFLSWVGITSPGEAPARAAPNHSPHFRAEEAVMLTGIRAMPHLMADATGSAVARLPWMALPRRRYPPSATHLTEVGRRHSWTRALAGTLGSFRYWIGPDEGTTT